MTFYDEIKLGFGHNLVTAFLPKKISLDQLAEIIKKESHSSIEKLGLFEASSPNYTTYYPDVTAADLVPEESDFIEPIFRALSEVIVHKAYNPVDFSMNGVLRKSLNLLNGQTINADHETALGNAMGAISAVSWQEAYKAGAVEVPAGINAKLKIDGKSNPRIVRMINMDPPGIHSSSVTVQFGWEKSHASLTENEFFSKLGTFDKDGSLIRRIANNIKSYREISLVNHGADPFAQLMGPDGKIINPKYANTVYNSADERNKAQATYNKKQKFFFYDLREDLIMNSEKDTIPGESNDDETSNTEDMKQLALALGLKETATEAEILAAINALNTSNSTVATLQAEVTRLKGESPDVAELAALRTFQTTHLTTRRGEVLAAYNKTTSTPLKATQDAIAGADLATLKILEDGYKADLERLMPAKCGDCGSTKINRASVTSNSADDEGGNTETESYQDRMLRKKRTENMHVGSKELPAAKK